MYAGMLLSLLLVMCFGVGMGDEGEQVKSYQGYSVLEVESLDDKNWMERQGCKSLSESILLCDRNHSQTIEHSATEEGIAAKFITRNLGKEIKEEAETSHGGNRGFKHQRYLGIKPMYEWLQELSENMKNMKIESIGKTEDGRDIKIVKINSDDSKLSTIFIDAGIHAREWISPAATLYLIERLVKAVAKGDKSISSFQWHIIPVANPDGYEYSRTKDRMWRKNTVKNPGSECRGVDLNRNFPKGYGIGASKDPCNPVFKGSNPLSEKESIAISSYITNTSNIKAAVSVHSYGNYIIYPWGYLKKKQHPRRRQLRSLAKKIRKAILRKTREKYTIGTAREVAPAWGVSGGATDDWYITQNIAYSYTFELPGRDRSGEHCFLLPPRNIIKVGKQLLEGFSAMARNLRKKL